MKVKEAVEHINKTAPFCGMREIEALYRHELLLRMKLRAHGSATVSKSMAEALVKEMNDWIGKVCAGLGWSEDACVKAREECNHTAVVLMNLSLRKVPKEHK